MRIHFDDSVRELLIREGTDPLYGARPFRRATVRLVEDALATRLISDYEAKITAVSVDADENGNMLIACD